MLGIVTGDEVVKWVASKTNEFGNFGCAVGMGVFDERIRAGVVFNDYNGPNMNIHVASDGSGRWLTRRFLWSVFHYAFEYQGVRRLTALVGEGNKPSRKFVEHIGFELETTLEDAHPTGKLMVYRMKKSQCRWINENLYQSRLRLAA